MTPDPEHRISAEHQAKCAIVYARQSTSQQVRSCRESTRLQLGLREKAISLGWTRPLVLEEDLGISAAGFVDRPGFQRMLSKVALREVGIIFCVDASRLSRNSKDWAHLFELCGHFRTLIADLEQVYDLSRPNDRLVLGIKGTISELELQVLRTRLRSGTEAKAARGELRFCLPAGYTHDPSGEIVFDPDRRAQAAIRQLFDQFDRSTSVRQLALWYHDTETLFPIKKRNRKTTWEVPVSKTLRNLLEHPIYAGTYVFGRTGVRVDCVDGRLIKRQVKLPPDEWPVCLRDHHAAYITWERFLANQAKIAENRPRWNMNDNRGAIRDGHALLAGLLRCGQCGRRIYVAHKKKSALYFCDAGQAKGSRRCLSFGSKLIDQRVGEELCRALRPLSVAAALRAAEQHDEQVAQGAESARLRVEAAQYEVDRAFEQFDLADPKNRLVVDSLEARLNEKLVALQEAKRSLETLADTQTRLRLTEEQRRRLEHLARDFPSVWSHPQVDATLKKRLLRAAILEVLVSCQETKEEDDHSPSKHRLEVTIHWKGGAHTRFHIKKRAAPRGRGVRTDPDLVGKVSQLAQSGLRDAEITRILNMQRLKTTHGLTWTQDRVCNFRKTHRIRQARPPEGEHLTQSEVASTLGISRNAVCALDRRGALSKNQITDFAPWRVPRSQLDSELVQTLVRVLKETGRLPKGGCPKSQISLFPDQ